MLYHETSGAGVPLLLVHGWGIGHALIWKNLDPLLARQFFLIKPDLPGIGRSPVAPRDQPYHEACASAIEELRNELGIERWAILAYSTGARAAEVYVQRFPQRVISLVYLCPAYFTLLGTVGLRLAQQVNRLYPAVADRILSVVTAGPILGFLVSLIGFNGRGGKDARIWATEMRKQTLDALKRSLTDIPLHRTYTDAARDTPVPTLYIWGRYDLVTVRPRPLLPSHVAIPACHAAPYLRARDVADALIPFVSNAH